MTWEELGEELLTFDKWGHFATARSQLSAMPWSGMPPHPVNLMVNFDVPVENYVPILIRAINELGRPSGLEGVVRALTKKNLNAAVEPLLGLFDDYTYTDDESLLWAVGNAVYTIAPREHLEACLRICGDSGFGMSRQHLIVHLSRFKKSEKVYEILISLLEDETVRGPALEALKRFGDIRAIPAIEGTPVREGDDFLYEQHQKKMALKKLNEKKAKLDM